MFAPLTESWLGGCLSSSKPSIGGRDHMDMEIQANIRSSAVMASKSNGPWETRITIYQDGENWRG